MDGAVTNAKLSSNSVNTSKISDSSITEAKIDTNFLSKLNRKIALQGDSWTTNKMVDNCEGELYVGFIKRFLLTFLASGNPPFLTVRKADGTELATVSPGGDGTFTIDDRQITIHYASNKTNFTMTASSNVTFWVFGRVRS